MDINLNSASEASNPAKTLDGLFLDMNPKEHQTLQDP
jgi:hypothetical protein